MISVISRTLLNRTVLFALGSLLATHVAQCQTTSGPVTFKAAFTSASANQTALTYNPTLQSTVGAPITNSSTGFLGSAATPDYSGTVKSFAALSGNEIYVSLSLPGPTPPTAYSGLAYAISDVDLNVNGPVFLEESIIADGHGLTPVISSGQAFIGFYAGGVSDALGLCRLVLNGGLQACSTGPVFIAGDEVVSISNQIGAFALTEFSGDQSTIDYWGTITPGPLQVFDQNMNFIESIDLASFTPTPEPSSLLLVPAGLVCLLRFVVRKRS